MLTQAELKTQLHYDTVTGIFTWLVSPTASVPIGATAGNLHRFGYHVIRINSRAYKAHRLAWLYITGAMPIAFIDHINRVRNDNRWSNLRAASASQNQMNRGRNCNNTSGYRGVDWVKSRGKWRAKVQISGKRITIGHYDDALSASIAYESYTKNIHGVFYIGDKYDN